MYQPEHFRDQNRTHYKELYKCLVLVTYLLTYLLTYLPQTMAIAASKCDTLTLVTL